MKRIFIILFFFIISPSLLTATTPEEERRVEEEKRGSLQATEVRPFKEKQVVSPPLAPIDMVYFAELMPKRVTFGYDICRVLIMLLGVENEYIDLNAQITFLKEKNIIPKNIKSRFDPMQPLRKGLAAYMLCKALDIKGGFWLRLFGVSQRYALKELAFQGIMPSGNVHDIVRGDELVLAYIQAVNYMEKRQRLQTSK